MFFFFLQTSRRYTTLCQCSSICFHIPASRLIHEDHGVRKTCLCPVWVAIPPQDIIVSSKQPQRFQKSPPFGRRFNLVYVYCSIVPLSTIPAFSCAPTILRHRIQCVLERLPQHGGHGACKRGAEGIRLRNCYNHRKVHATRTHPQGTRHLLESAIRLCTFRLADTILFSAFDDLQCQSWPHAEARKNRSFRGQRRSRTRAALEGLVLDVHAISATTRFSSGQMEREMDTSHFKILLMKAIL